MATLVKEKRREKKKSKMKQSSEVEFAAESPPVINLSSHEESKVTELENTVEVSINESTCATLSKVHTEIEYENVPENHINLDTEASSPREQISDAIKVDLTDLSLTDNLSKASTSTSIDTYANLSLTLDRVCKPATTVSISKEREQSMEKENAYLTEIAMEAASEADVPSRVTENEVSETAEVAPSAPMLEFSEPPAMYHEQVFVQEVPKLVSMPLEEAIKLFGGKEIAEVMAMSEREEAIVEADDISGPDHPLHDLLSTFKSSLLAVDRERFQLMVKLSEEEKYRNSLWKIEKRYINHSEKCECGETVQFRASYEHAELQDKKLPIAKMKLEGILRDVADSYCHHQQAAMLAYYQIEEFVSETINGSKSEIREALSLVLQALKMSDNAPAALSHAFQRWCVALAGALVDARDLRQLLFLLHQLFRQTRSVHWAASVVNVPVTDSVSAARAIALLDVLLTRSRLECAVECTEDKDEEWEEVGKDGGGGAVSDGTLRERDMLALLRAFPLRDLVARLALITQADLSASREWQWSESSGGRCVLRACGGVRALVHVLGRAAHAHAHYARLRRALRRLALSALRALAALHERNWQSYSKEYEIKIRAELEAAFVGGWSVLGPGEAHLLPACLLSRRAALDYCVAHIDHLHDPNPFRVESLSLDVAAQECGARVTAVASAASGRRQDYDLARVVMEFLFQTGVRTNRVTCGGACAGAARAALPQLLAAHPHLHAGAWHLVAEASQVDKLDPSSIACLAADKWRPQPDEVRAVAADWAQRCPHLLPSLLLNLDCTPHTGVSLEAQLAVGAWLCAHVRARAAPGAAEWCWGALRRLRAHRTCWALRPDAPPPDPEPDDLFSKAFALMASSWGHCIPLICSEGVSALCSLAAARAADAVHFLAPLMLVLVDSPESIASTQKFTEFFALVLNAGPTIVQRALGRAAPSGADLLTRLVTEQLSGEGCGGVPHTALVRVWIWALWRASLPAATARLASALRPRHAWQLAECAQHQTEDWSEQMCSAMRMPAQAPLVCYAALQAWLTQRELNTALLPRLNQALHAQRIARQRIHVANALKLIGSSISADDLVIYRTAAALLAAPHTHVAHLQLWALFMYLYLQRPQFDAQNSLPPVGPLFFSGIIKSRTLAQLKRRLQDTIAYHQNELIRLPSENPEPTPKPTTSRIVKSKSRSPDYQLAPLSITDLTCDSSESSESDGSEEEVENTQKDSTQENNETHIKNVKLTIMYHCVAETMLKKYATWLEEGEKSRVEPHEADITRFMKEHMQEAAWELSASGSLSPTADREPFPLPPPRPPAPVPPAPTPYEALMNLLMSIRTPRRKRSRQLIKPPIENVDFKDARSLLTLVDTHLKDLQKLAKEISADIACISNLNTALWKLVQAQRVSRPLPVMKKCCSNKCKTIVYAPPDREWCISVGAEQGIKENRSKAIACIQRLLRPQPHAARTAAALLSIARRTRTSEAAKRMAELVLQHAAAFPEGNTSTLTAFLDLLAERWLDSDGVACAYLIRRSYNNKNAHALIGALVAPQRVLPAHAPALHAAVLRGPLAPSEMFSYLSRFEMGRWADVATSEARQEILNELMEAACRWGSRSDPEHQMIVELVGLQSAAVCRAPELCGLVRACARACAAGRLPPAHVPQAARALQREAPALTCDQLGHLLRELGVIWWEARTGVSGARHARYAAYAPAVGGLTAALHRTFVAAAVRLSYAPQRVGTLAWASLLESLSAWVAPHSAAPLLPSTGDEEHYTPMLLCFRLAVQQVMTDCPGTEEYLLSQMFEWTIQTYLSVHNSPNQENRVQISAFLAEMAKAPWTQHQWLQAGSLQAMLQVCLLNDKELAAWCSAACSAQETNSWLRPATPDQLPARMALLVHLFTSGFLLDDKILEAATRMPWGWLAEAALEDALERYFALHYSPAVPYHDLPHFRVILAAGELLYVPDVGMSVSSSSRQKRCHVVSRWVRAAAAPALAPHARAHAQALLAAVARAGVQLAGSEGEIEELLNRALVIMCIEPAAAAALPVWESWVRTTSGLLRRACVSCVSGLTTFEYYAPLADAAVRAYFTTNDCPSWSSIAHMWAGGHWRDAAPLCARARLHAAYATLLAHVHSVACVRAALLALVATDLDFVENEAIVATWICAACRVARSLGSLAAEGEARAAARALLGRWAERARRSLLQIVALQPSTTSPTPQHRLLSLFALCVLTPNSDKEARAFEAACASVPGLSPDVVTWGRSPHPKRLPRLAMRLYPNYEKYFTEELDMTPEESI